MVVEKAAGKTEIKIRKGAFDAEGLYKLINKKIMSLGYIFAEKEQKAKPNQYGKNVKSVFMGFKDIDEFVKGRVIITMIFEKINKIKTNKGVFDQGDIRITIEGKIIVDFENKWEKTQFKRWLLNVYLKYFKPLMKKKYIVPTAKDVGAIQKAIKEKLEMY